MKAVIFDFDGVLHDTSEFHRGKIKDFFGVGLSKKQFSDMHLGNIFSCVPQELKNADWTAYEKFMFDEYVSFDIIKETKILVSSLAKDFDLYLVTSGGESNILQCLQNNNLDGYFKKIFGRQTSISKIEKFHMLFKEFRLQPEDCVFITDTLGDIVEAHKVGLNVIALDYGYHTKEILKQGDPLVVVSSPKEVYAYINKNFPNPASLP